jgi:hypothetical protein
MGSEEMPLALLLLLTAMEPLMFFLGKMPGLPLIGAMAVLTTIVTMQQPKEGKSALARVLIRPLALQVVLTLKMTSHSGHAVQTKMLDRQVVQEMMMNMELV